MYVGGSNRGEGRGEGVEWRGSDDRSGEMKKKTDRTEKREERRERESVCVCGEERQKYESEKGGLQKDADSEMERAMN